jgi:hypothetical protein
MFVLRDHIAFPAVRRCFLQTRVREIPYIGTTTGIAQVIVRDERVSPTSVNLQVYYSDFPEAAHHFDGIQVTESETHPRWKDLRKGHFRGDLGGPFRSTKNYSELINAHGNIHNFLRDNTNHITTEYFYLGLMLPMGPSNFVYPSNYFSDNSSLNKLGATAISRCSPSNATADLGVAIGEIFSEGLPSIIGGSLKALRDMTHRQRRKALGHEYLNVEFGWKPFINDLQKTAKSLLHAQSIIDGYEKNSGKLVRRRYEFPEVHDSEIVRLRQHESPWVTPDVSGFYDFDYVNQGEIYRSFKGTKRQWFSGAFTYFVPPPGDGLRSDIARQVIFARKLLGLSLTPDVVWNLFPWSWAIDWFTNTSDVLQNWTDWAIDNQVLAYGYMMEHSIAEYTYTFSGPTGYRAGSEPGVVKMTSEVKLRTQATPYGFGLTWEDLSPRQLAIIGALGMSRGH